MPVHCEKDLHLLVALTDSSGRRFDNFSSLALEWSLSNSGLATVAHPDLLHTDIIVSDEGLQSVRCECFRPLCYPQCSAVAWEVKRQGGAQILWSVAVALIFTWNADFSLVVDWTPDTLAFIYGNQIIVAELQQRKWEFLWQWLIAQVQQDSPHKM